MAIPTTDLFNEFLGKSRVVERPTGAATLLSMAVGQPTFYFEYPQTALTLDSVLRVISRELAERGCAATRGVALATLAAIVSTTEDGASAVEHGNSCLSQVHLCDVFQYLVLPQLADATTRRCLASSESGPSILSGCVLWTTREEALTLLI